MKPADWYSRYYTSSFVLCSAQIAITRHLNGGDILGPRANVIQAREIVDEAMSWLPGLQPAFTGERLSNGSYRGDRAAEAHNRPIIRAHLRQLCAAMGVDCAGHFDRLVAHH